MPVDESKHHEAYLILGSNLGDRFDNLKKALGYIHKYIGDIVETSSIYETEPWGVVGHASYLNAVVRVRTDLAPGKLMSNCLHIETKFSRQRRGAVLPRKMDIDILSYDESEISQKKVIIPHPRLHLRRFALIPLTEIAPDLMHPVLECTMSELLTICPDDSIVTKIARSTNI
jgi:2-amino-4-hydroxy-6-hydroxymethyldihydropteridine diphosphokinase